jgi:hypothetical protein
VRLQGWGAPSTVINAVKTPAEKLQAWRDKVSQLLAADTFDLLPGQETGFNAPNNEPNLFNTEEAPGIMVVAKATGPQSFNNSPNARIDGLTVTGADHGGGIFASGHADFLEISNNRVINNYGTYGGGIRVGHPNLINPEVVAADDTQYGGYTDASNDNLRIHHNQVRQNGGGGEAGGGVVLYTGSDNYLVVNNTVCGNFTAGNGGGIAHLGRSDDGRIANNTVIFNQSFNQGLGVSGGGIFVGGSASLAPAATPRLSPGTGNVTVEANLIQGNLAGAGDGGGIRAEFVNGLDIGRVPNNPNTWYQLTLANNMVVDNVAGLAGGGVSLQDTVKAAIVNNTIANNDSTATAGAAFAPGNPNQSDPQPAGIVSRAHSTLLYGTIGSNPAALPYKKEYADPTLTNNIVWHNRSFSWGIDNSTVPASFGLTPNIGAGDPASYWDLEVLGTSNPAHQLNPQYSILSDATGYAASNFSADPKFVAAYVNGDRGQTIQQPELTTSIATAPAFDEGGNFIDVRFGPLMPTGDYHLQSDSPARAMGTTPPLVNTDFDGESRPIPVNTASDIGADELAGLPPPPALPSLTVLDNFNRADANRLGTSWSQLPGGAGAAVLRVNGNQAFAQNVGGQTAPAYAIWNVPVAGYGAQQGAAFTFANAPLDGSALVLKGTSGIPTPVPQRFIRVRYAAGQVVVETTTNGNVASPTFTVRATFPAPFVSGERLSATAYADGTVNVFRTAVGGAPTTLVGTVTVPITGPGAWTWGSGGGRIGMQMPIGQRVDDFAGGTLP